jgi:hypothetical protein
MAFDSLLLRGAFHFSCKSAPEGNLAIERVEVQSVPDLSVPDRIDVCFTAGLDFFLLLWIRERNVNKQQCDHDRTTPPPPDQHIDTSPTG